MIKGIYRVLFSGAFVFLAQSFAFAPAFAKDKGEIAFVGSGVKKAGSLAELRLACVKQGKKKCKSYQFVHKMAAVQWKVGAPLKKVSERKLRQLFFDEKYCVAGRGAPDCLRPEFFPIDFKASRVLTPFSLTQKFASKGLNEAIFGTFFADVLMMGVTFPVHSVVALKNSATKRRLNSVLHAWLNPEYDVTIPGALFEKVLARVTQEEDSDHDVSTKDDSKSDGGNEPDAEDHDPKKDDAKEDDEKDQAVNAPEPEKDDKDKKQEAKKESKEEKKSKRKGEKKDKKKQKKKEDLADLEEETSDGDQKGGSETKTPEKDGVSVAPKDEDGEMHRPSDGEDD